MSLYSHDVKKYVNVTTSEGSIVLARASRLVVAAAGSSGFVMFPSGVTITLQHSESSNDFGSHLVEHYVENQFQGNDGNLIRITVESDIDWEFLHE
ncbi:hypothetical protein Leryth_021837 [Lithospermum erythrorhizon]|nr:hypothetical protein Leryth_021837 [Lithospermum erythrorhizon]